MEHYITPMRQALLAMMDSVALNQRATSLGKKLENEAKPDGTNVTVADYASESAAMPHLEGLPVFAEERGLVGVSDDIYEILVDPLDGTRPFLNAAPTSTNIVALYNKQERQITACLVGEPVSGRVWEYFPCMDAPALYYHNNPENKFVCQVYEGSIGPKVTTYIDLYPGFTKFGSASLTNEEQSAVFSRLFGKVSAVSMFGSNAIHHALVSMGKGHDVAGAITTCLGGAWDVAPALLVQKAGGCVRGFRRELGVSVFTECDPLDIKLHHFTVSGNSEATVGKLVDALTGK